MTIKQGRLYRIPDREATANHLYAGVDLGSNTFRLLVGRVKSGRVEPLLKKMHTVRLGEGLHHNGRISAQANRRGQDALADFRSILDRYQLDAVRVCGTAALRIAANQEHFLSEATTILGSKAEVIDGEQEAHLSGIGAFAAMIKPPAEPILLADIGGGSSELLVAVATADTPEIRATVSLPLGAVNLSETFLRTALPSKNDLAAMGAHIKTVLLPTIAAMELLPATLVGIGGTATALAALDCNLTTYDSDRVQDHQLTLADLERLLARLSCLSGSERNQLPGLDHGRGEIIIGGLLILLTLLKVMPCPKVTVSDGGLLEGILLSVAKAGKQH